MRYVSSGSPFEKIPVSTGKSAFSFSRIPASFFYILLVPKRFPPFSDIQHIGEL